MSVSVDQAIAYSGFLAIAIALFGASLMSRRASILSLRFQHALLFFRIFMLAQAISQTCFFVFGVWQFAHLDTVGIGMSLAGYAAFLAGLNIAVERRPKPLDYLGFVLAVAAIALMSLVDVGRQAQIHLLNFVYTLMMVQIFLALSVPQIRNRRASFLIRLASLLMIVPIIARSVYIMLVPDGLDLARFIWLTLNSTLVIMLTTLTLLLLIWSMLSRFRDQSLTDPLTGLQNRRSLDAWYQRMRSLSRRKQSKTGILVCDLDRFKRINDDFGHETGDAVLREFAEILRKSTRESDFIARVGGEEFVIIMPMVDSLAVESLAERVRSLTASAPFRIGELSLPVTTSIGAGLFDGDTELRAAIEASDINLYKAKQEGRNRVIFLNYDAVPDDSADNNPAWSGS